MGIITHVLTETFLGQFGGPFHPENNKPQGQETPRLGELSVGRVSAGAHFGHSATVMEVT